MAGIPEPDMRLAQNWLAVGSVGSGGKIEPNSQVETMNEPLTPTEDVAALRRLEEADAAASELNDVLRYSGLSAEVTVASCDDDRLIRSGEFIAEYGGLYISLLRRRGVWRTNLHALAEAVAHAFVRAEENEVERRKDAHS